MKIRAITISQPYAELIASGAKSLGELVSGYGYLPAGRWTIRDVINHVHTEGPHCLKEPAMPRRFSRKMKHKPRRCSSGKLRYRSKREAIDANRKIGFGISMQGDTPNEMRAYWCPDCSGWHLARRDPNAPLKQPSADTTAQ